MPLSTLDMYSSEKKPIDRDEGMVQGQALQHLSSNEKSY